MIDSGETLLIGVDGGGTGCRVVIGTATKGVISQAAGERANISNDPLGAVVNICSTVLSAAQKAGFDTSDLKSATAHLGLAGVLSEQTAQFVADSVPYKNCAVTSDVPTAVIGALDGANGFLAAIGTGSFVAAHHDQRFNHVGGWGLNVSDQASGSWLGREALNRTLQCHDGLIQHTELTRNLLSRFENDPAQIATFGINASPRDFGEFCPSVVQAAGANDNIGVALMELGADYILQGLAALEFKTNDRLCLGGGVGPHYSVYLKKRRPIQIDSPKGSAVVGAFKMAMIAEQKSTGVST